MLVNAGPGTGKTQILATRIGNILYEGRAESHNILCLTFTDAAAVNMRKRLFEIIGPEAYRIHIHTFHSFCNDIIQDNLDYFGKLNLEAISELEKVELFRKLVNRFKEGHPLKRYRGDVYFEVSRLMNLFSIMKREYWSTEYVCTQADRYIQAVEEAEEGHPYYKTFKYVRKTKDKQAGDLKPAFEKEKNDIELLKAAAREYPNYQKLMAESNRYDFDDMILWVIDAFTKDKNFLVLYQERYHYFLIDEFQDTSGAQNELISLLIDYHDNPNVFVVGDGDQSIYRFQGANIENIENFKKKFEKQLNEIMLVDNYRSTQIILDTAKALIDLNTTRVEDTDNPKTLIAKNKEYAELSIEPEIIEYNTPFDEFASVTSKVHKLIAEEGVNPDDIAIIYKEHKSGEELAQFFQRKGIPVNSKKKVDILKIPFGKKLLTILEYLAAELEIPYSGDELLFEIMHYDFYEIDPIDIARISASVTNLNYSAKIKEKTSIRNEIEKLSKKQADMFESKSMKDIRRLSSDIEYWIKEAANLTLQNLFEKIVNRGGVLAYILKSPEKTWYMQVLTSVFNFLKEESRRNPNLDLKRFINTLSLLEENNISLELNKTIISHHGVNFLTCHASKGLEFEYVFIISTISSYWEKKRKRSITYKIPSELFNHTYNDADDIEELRRLFYVAMTRTEKQLEISYYSKDNKEKDVERSLFVSEIISRTDLKYENREPTESEIADFFGLHFKDEEEVNIPLLDHVWIDEQLANYALSVTNLNNYLYCPLKFYFQNLVRVPSGKTETLTFGSSIHWGLEKFFRLSIESKEFPGVEVIIQNFEWYMNHNREAFTKEQFERRMEYGRIILQNYYNEYIHKWELNALPEFNIKNVELDGIPIKGKIDKIEFKGENLNVVDYKTGSYENAKIKFEPPNEKDPNGGDYWRQAVFYKILIDNYKHKNWNVISTEFDFIEPVKDKGNANDNKDSEVFRKERILIKDEDVRIVKQQIKEVYAKIQNHEFTKGCGRKDCEWCNFVKNNFRDYDIMQPEDDE